MKLFFAIVWGILLTSSPVLGQTWKDGYRGAELQMRKLCAQQLREPTAVEHCIIGQRGALEILKNGKPAGLSQDAFELIRWRCEEDQPADFILRVECERRQTEALETLRNTHPVDISPEGFKSIRQSCTGAWPYDFVKRLECEDKEIGELRELRQRGPQN